MVKQVKLDFFSESRVALDREIKSHPKLIELLKNQPPNEFEMRLAEIARYCDVVLYGDYLPSDLDRLCEILRNKLWEKRMPLIIN